MKKIIRSLESDNTKNHLLTIIILLSLIEFAIPSWRIGISICSLILTIPFMYSINYSIGQLQKSEKNQDFYTKYLLNSFVYSLIFVFSLRYLSICIFRYYSRNETIYADKKISDNILWGIILWILFILILRNIGRNKAKKEHL